MWAALIKIIVGLGGAAMGGSAARDAAEYNAKVIQQKADSVAQAKEADTKTLQRKSRGLKAEQRAAYSKGGAMIGQGTPLLVMVEEAGNMQRDILNYRRNRLMEEQQLRHEAEIIKWEGKRQEWAAMTSMGSSGAQGMGTLLGNSGGGGGGGTSGYVAIPDTNRNPYYGSSGTYGGPSRSAYNF